MSNQWNVEKVAKDLPANVKRWVLRGGAVPDAVWFGDYVYLKQRVDACMWRRSEFCERLADYLRAEPAHDKGEPKP